MSAQKCLKCERPLSFWRSLGHDMCVRCKIKATTFHYGQKVRITQDFYKGQKVVLVGDTIFTNKYKAQLANGMVIEVCDFEIEHCEGAEA